jgi:hypothetical protein
MVPSRSQLARYAWRGLRERHAVPTLRVGIVRRPDHSHADRHRTFSCANAMHLRLMVESYRTVRFPVSSATLATEGVHSGGNASRTPRLIGHRIFRNPHWSKEDSVEQVIRMFRRWSGATRNGCLRPSTATACSRSATAVSRNCALVAATAGRFDHRRASATTACGRSARRGPCASRGSAAAALQGRPFPRRARRQWDRCEVRGRRTDARLRRYHDAVPRQARDRPSADDGIRSAAVTCGGDSARPQHAGQIARGDAHRGLVTRCEGWRHQLNCGALRVPGDASAKAGRGIARLTAW